MQKFDLNSIEPDYVGEILSGVMGEANSVFLNLFTPLNVASQSGKVPILPSENTMGSDHPTESSKIAINDLPTRLSNGLDSVAFSFDFKYSAEGLVHRIDVEALAASGLVNSSEDLLRIVFQKAMVQVASDVDKAGKAVLDAISNTQAAAAVWSSAGTATPITDLDALIWDKAPGADFLWLGHTEARELAKLPAITAMTNNFNGLDGSASFGQLASYLQNRYMLQDVLIGGNWFNAEAPPVAITKTRRFDGMVVAGKRDHIVTTEFGAMRETNQGYKTDGSQMYYGNTTLYVDINDSGDNQVARLTSF